MADIAQLGFRAEYNELTKAEKQLDKISDKSKKTESNVVKLSNGFTKANSESKKMASGFSALDKISQRVTRQIIAMAASVAAFATAAVSFNAVITGARELARSIAELSTLLPIGTQFLEDMKNGAIEMAVVFGTSASNQIKSFYQAVSAGATNSAQAIEVVDTANRLAIGGITDVTIGVDVLTTATNAYTASNLKAADASDALFVGMKAGKTTIGELGSSLGQVIPIAAALKVNFDELVAGVAALTTQGLSTATAVTSLRAILSGIAKPTNEASKLAKQLGLDFSTTALASKGLSGFLTDVIAKTNGSADRLSILFGSVEALNAALAFAGGGGQKFNEILDQMNSKAGATDEAFNKVASNLDFRFNKILNELSVGAADFGTTLLSVLVPAMEYVADNIDTIGKLATVGAITLAVMFGPQIIGGIKAFALAINEKAVVAVWRLTAAITMNPIGFLVTVLTTAIATLTVFRNEIKPIAGEIATLGDYMSVLWDDIKTGASIVLDSIFNFGNTIVDYFSQSFNGIFDIWDGFDINFSNIFNFVKKLFKNVVNFIIGSWVASYHAIIEIWNNFPAAIADLVIQGANGVIAATEDMINSVSDSIAPYAKKLGIEFGKTTFGRITNPFKNSAGKFIENIGSVVKKSLTTDYLGNTLTTLENYGTSVRTRANELANLKEEQNQVKDSTEQLTQSLNNQSVGNNSVNNLFDGLKTRLGEIKQGFLDIFAPGGMLSKGIGDAVSGALLFGDTFTESLKNIGLSIVSHVISGLAEIGTQMLLNKVLGSTLLAAATTESAAAAGATAAAWAPAAAAASVATAGGAAAAGFSAASLAIAGIVGLVAGLAVGGGFKNGGYTGSGNPNDPAGIVHKGEYVLDAKTTKRIGLNNLNNMSHTGGLPAINTNQIMAGSGSGVNVSIENYGTSKEFDVQQIDENTVRIIAKDEAEKAVNNKAPTVIANQIRNPNSTVSKSIGQNTQTQRRRG